MTILKSSRVNLRPLVKEDAALLYEWLNDAEIMLSLGDEIYGKFSKSELEKEIEAHPQGNSYQFMIETKEGVGIGRCILFNVDSSNNSAMMGIFLGDRKQWGKGLAKEAMELLIEFGFGILNLHSIFLGVFAFNERARRLYESIGFEKIGVRREVRLINGKYYDAVLMDLLACDYTFKHLDLGNLSLYQ